MKKILLGTTVLFGAAAIATSAQAAPSVSIGGFIDFQAGASDQDSAFETGANSRELKFQNDTEIHVNVAGKTDTGLAYGATIELEADVNADPDGEGLNADKTFIYFSGDELGRIELGNNTDAAAALKIDAASIASATGGINGDFDEFANLTGYLINSKLPTQNAANVTEDATKISYYTPIFSGFQGGISYTPDQGDGGTSSGFTGENNGDQENVFNLGIQYKGSYNSGLGVEASLTGEFGESETAATEDLSAWAAGVVFKYQSWSFAGSWADLNESGLAVGSTNDDQGYWTLGTAYATGPYSVSVTYIDSETQNNEFNNIVVGADYKLAAGLVPYVEVSFFDTDDNTAGTDDNDGSVVLVGAELKF